MKIRNSGTSYAGSAISYILLQNGISEEQPAPEFVLQIELKEVEYCGFFGLAIGNHRLFNQLHSQFSWMEFYLFDDGIQISVV